MSMAWRSSGFTFSRVSRSVRAWYQLPSASNADARSRKKPGSSGVSRSPCAAASAAASGCPAARSARARAAKRIAGVGRRAASFCSSGNSAAGASPWMMISEIFTAAG